MQTNSDSGSLSRYREVPVKRVSKQPVGNGNCKGVPWVCREPQVQGALAAAWAAWVVGVAVGRLAKAKAPT